MARFIFRVVDGSGNVRRGTMEATSLEAARHQAELRGYTVEDLRPVAAEPQIQVHADTRRQFRTGAAPARPYRGSWAERAAEKMPTPQKLIRGLLGVAGLGMLWMAAGFRTAPSPPAAVAASAAREQSARHYQVEVVGDVPRGAHPVITLGLPDIPYQESFAWDKLEHPAANSFVARLDVRAAREARALTVRARQDDKVASLGPLRMSDASQQFPGLHLKWAKP